MTANHRSQHNEIRSKPQEKEYKKYKQEEAKPYVTKQTMDHWINQKRNKKMPKEKWKWKHNDPKPMGCCKSSSNTEVYSNTILPQEKEKHQLANLTLHHKQLEKEEKQQQQKQN